MIRCHDSIFQCYTLLNWWNVIDPLVNTHIHEVSTLRPAHHCALNLKNHL